MEQFTSELNRRDYVHEDVCIQTLQSIKFSYIHNRFKKKNEKNNKTHIKYRNPDKTPDNVFGPFFHRRSIETRLITRIIWRAFPERAP